MSMVKKIQSDSNLLSAAMADSDMETSLCPICKSSNMSIIHIFKPFKVVSCRNCDLIYLNPRFKESVMEKIYQKGKYFVEGGHAGYTNYITQEQSLRITFRKFLNELKRRGMTSGRLLEVGCGYGYFLDEAKNFFSYSAGTELSAKARAIAQQLTGAEIFANDIALLPSHFKNFDIIILINVIEHIYTPLEFVKALKQRLKKGGKMVIATPDIGSLWYKLMKKKWPSFKIPEHVVFYTKKTLISLLDKAGFHNIEQIPFPHAFPLGLITSKLGIYLPESVCQKPVWLPGTMIALAARTI